MVESVNKATRELEEIDAKVLETLNAAQWCVVSGDHSSKPNIVDFGFAVLLYRLHEEVDPDNSDESIAGLARALFDDRLFNRQERRTWRYQVADKVYAYANLCLEAGGDYLLTFFDRYARTLNASMPLFSHRVWTGSWKREPGDHDSDMLKMAAQLREFLTKNWDPGQAEPVVETQEDYDAEDELRRAQFDAAVQKLFGGYHEQSQRWLEDAKATYESLPAVDEHIGRAHV